MAVPAYPSVEQLLGGCLFGIAAGAVSFRLKFLTTGGAIAAVFLGAVVFGIGGLRWTLPMLAFFIPSSILSMIVGRLRPRISQSFEKTGTRDYAQVLANGGVGGCLVILSLIVPDSRLYLLYLGSLAAVAADTWGTEVGVLVQGKTWLVTTMREVSPGRSGGVSAAGLLGGVVGALIVGLSGAPWVEGSSGRLVPWLAAAGLFGSLVDSLLGATIQARYTCDICGTVTERREHCGAAAHPAGGLSWFTNDVVNLIASIAGAAGVWGR